MRTAIYVFPTVALRNTYQRLFPEWGCYTWYDVICQRADRVVVVHEFSMHGAEINLKFQRVLDKARLRVAPGGKLAVVSAQGLPLWIERDF
jgi:hypothetical protein